MRLLIPCPGEDDIKVNVSRTSPAQPSLSREGWPIGETEEPDIQECPLTESREPSSIILTLFLTLLPSLLLLHLFPSVYCLFLKQNITFPLCIQSAVAQAALSHCSGPFGVSGRRLEFYVVACSNNKIRTAISRGFCGSLCLLVIGWNLWEENINGLAYLSGQ